jgi:hypothetical protein
MLPLWFHLTNHFSKRLLMLQCFYPALFLFQATSLNQQCALAGDVALIPLTHAFVTDKT